MSFFFVLVNCPLGYFFNSSGCQACANDKYQDQEAQSECVSCPSGTSTFGQTGSKWSKDCQGKLKLFVCFVCLSSYLFIGLVPLLILLSVVFFLVVWLLVCLSVCLILQFSSNSPTLLMNI